MTNVRTVVTQRSETNKDRHSVLMSTTQEAYADANRCLRARKCALVPFKDSKKPNGKGCCPGQTGHHILPDSMFRSTYPAAMVAAKAKYLESYTGKSENPSLPRNKKPNAECWDDYSEGGAPTICLEGGASTGSHGTFHKQTKRKINFIRGSNRNMPYVKSRKAVA